MQMNKRQSRSNEKAEIKLSKVQIKMCIIYVELNVHVVVCVYLNQTRAKATTLLRMQWFGCLSLANINFDRMCAVCCINIYFCHIAE